VPGEAEIGTQPLPPERVSQIFHQVFNINGEGNNIATGSSDFTQSTSYQVKKGDVQSLHSYLKSLGIWDDDCDELCDALKAEIRPKQSGLMGPKVGVDWKDGCKGSVGFMGRVPSYRARITHKGDFCILRLGVNWIRAA